MLLIALPVILVAQGLQPLDVAKLQYVRDLDISDDGEVIAYTLSVPADPLAENRPARYHLYLFDIDEGEAIPYVSRGSVSQVTFRPGHQSITFLNRLEDDKTRSIYEISLQGGEARKLYSFKTSISYYEWAPDGETLAFIAGEPKEQEPVELPYQPEIYEGELSYDRAYISKVDEEEPRQLISPDHIQTLSWSPDGSMIAVRSSPTPLVDDYYMKQGIRIFDAKFLKVKAQVDHDAKMGPMAWSPDGEKLAFIAGAHINDPIDGRLFVVSAEGGEPDNLRPDYAGQFHQIRWWDNDNILYLASEGVWSVTGTISADGKKDVRLTGHQLPIINQFDRSESGLIAYVAESTTHPAEVYLNSEEEDAPVRMTNHNPWLNQTELGIQEVIRYKARDGMEIEGMLIKPLDYDESKTYPAVVVVHGGPESHYDYGWLTSYSQPGQMAAAEGMVAFYPNYRGSTGRGLEFAMSSQGDPAGKEFDDIVDGIDYLIEQGIVDGDKVGVTGGSYGGYATGWMSTRYTDRFAAGVMSVGISNNISKWGTSDIPEELYLVHSRMRIWEDYDFFLKRSPIYYAGQAKTPLLIMHGKEDTRVHPSQSMELYRHIKTRTNTPVQLVFYPGEGHGNRNATARLDFSYRMMGWFNKYLKPKTMP